MEVITQAKERICKHGKDPATFDPSGVDLPGEKESIKGRQGESREVFDESPTFGAAIVTVNRAKVLAVFVFNGLTYSPDCRHRFAFRIAPFQCDKKQQAEEIDGPPCPWLQSRPETLTRHSFKTIELRRSTEKLFARLIDDRSEEFLFVAKVPVG